MADALQPPPAAGLPSHVGSGRYTLGRVIGEGGSAVVVRAEGPRGPCALKLRQVPDRPIEAARFLAEPLPMSEIASPHVVKVFETGREQGWYWIAMQLFERGTVRDLVRRHGVPPLDDALRLIEEALDGLQAVHDAGFVHRDVKPQNLFVGDDGRAVLGDFGVARHLNNRLWFRTRTGQAIGTMGYRAPEQDNDAREAGVEADVYGAAATLYFVLTGERPPLLYASRAEPRQLERLPSAVQPIVARATAYEPEQRYRSARAFHDAIRAERERLRAAEGLPPIGATPSPSPGRLRALLDRWIG